MSALELVFRYRQLVGSCDAGAGVSLADIEIVSTIEALYAIDSPDDGWRNRPTLGMEQVQLAALLRGRKVYDRVPVISMGPERLICARAPYMEEGSLFEIVFDDDELQLSYRFVGEVISTADDPEGMLEVELIFRGAPVLVRYGKHSMRPASEGEDPLAEGTPTPMVVGSNAA